MEKVNAVFMPPANGDLMLLRFGTAGRSSKPRGAYCYELIREVQRHDIISNHYTDNIFCLQI